MFQLFKNCFKQTNDSIILATPLIIFLSILGWYLSYATGSVDSIPKLVLAIITTLVMASGFFSAWFYMVKKTLKLSNKVFVFDKDRAKAFGELIMSLPKGIGKLFLPFLGVISISAIIYGLIIAGITFLVYKYIGSVNIDLLNSNNLLVSSKELFEELSQLPREEIIVINCWYMLVLATITIVSFFFILWIPEIVYSEKNPFKALINSLKKIWLTRAKTLLLYLYINVLSFIISIFSTLLMFNPISYFLVLLLYYYFIVYIIVLIFTYYEITFYKDAQ